MAMPSKLSENIAPFYVMDVLEKAKEIERSGQSVIHFEVGEPDFDTASVISDAAIESLKSGDTKYTHSLGKSELRSAISEEYHKSYGVGVSPERVIVTMGSSPALFLSILSLIDPGDEVIITDPHYACYPKIIQIAGGVPKMFKIYESEGFQIDVSRLKKSITKKTKAIIINSPSNPTGVVLAGELMDEISGLGPVVISDEIYHGLVYEGRAHTILEYSPDAISVNGFSKFYSMTGWRLGYVVAPPELIRPIQKLQQNLFISPNSFVQMAGITALKEAKNEALEMIKSFDARRKRMIEGLRGLGFEITHEPKGAFYVFVNACKLSNNSYDLAFDILDKAHVAVTPGIDFGENGEGYLRFSYAVGLETIDEGLQRLGRYIQQSAT